MIKFLFILLFFIHTLGFSQETDIHDHYNKVDTEFESRYKNQDTLFVYFKRHKNEKETPLRLIVPPKIMEKQYAFEFHKSEHFYGFSFKTHKNSKGKQVQIPIIEKDRKFFKKNKSRILTYCKLKKLSPKDLESFFWKNHNKVVYLINKEENKGNNIFLKQVSFYSGYRIIQ